MARWTQGPGATELGNFGSSVEQVMAETRVNTPVSREHAALLVDWFVALD